MYIQTWSMPDSQHVRMPDVDDHPVCFMNVYDKLDKTNRTMVISTWKRTKSCQVLHLNVLQPIRGPHSSRGWERKNILRRRSRLPQAAMHLSIYLSLSLSLSGIYQYSKWTLHKGYHSIHYTPQLEIIPKKTKNRFLLRTPKWRSPKTKSF